MSDVPNATLADGNIIEVNKINDNQAEIILDKPLKDGLKENTKVRIHGFTGAHLYTNTKVLNPGEEITFNSTIKKDEDFLQYSSKAFARGVYYVVPIIISYSTDSNKDNAILIRDFELSY